MAISKFLQRPARFRLNESRNGA